MHPLTRPRPNTGAQTEPDARARTRAYTYRQVARRGASCLYSGRVGGQSLGPGYRSESSYLSLPPARAGVSLPPGPSLRPGPRRAPYLSLRVYPSHGLRSESRSRSLIRVTVSVSVPAMTPASLPPRRPFAPRPAQSERCFQMAAYIRL
jgi:hypothetical protein